MLYLYLIIAPYSTDSKISTVSRVYMVYSLYKWTLRIFRSIFKHLFLWILYTKNSHLMIIEMITSGWPYLRIQGKPSTVTIPNVGLDLLISGGRCVCVRCVCCCVWEVAAVCGSRVQPDAAQTLVRRQLIRLIPAHSPLRIAAYFKKAISPSWKLNWRHSG